MCIPFSNVDAMNTVDMRWLSRLWTFDTCEADKIQYKSLVGIH